MITDIQHPKLNKGISILYSKNKTRKECVQKNQIINKSANVNFTGGFFRPDKPDKNNFGQGFWSKLGENKHVKNFIKSHAFDNFLKKTDSLAWTESVFFFAVATSIKPATIMALPGAKEEDKKYAATKAFLGGAVDFAISSAIVLPIVKIIENIKPEKIAEKVDYLKDAKKFKAFKKIIEYLPKFMLIPVRSALTIALIPPTLKYFFPEEAKRAKAKKEAEMKGGSK